MSSKQLDEIDDRPPRHKKPFNHLLRNFITLHIICCLDLKMDTEKRRRNKVFDEIYCSGQSIADIFFCVIAIWLGPDIALHKEARS